MNVCPWVKWKLHSNAREIIIGSSCGNRSPNDANFIFERAIKHRALSDFSIQMFGELYVCLFAKVSETEQSKVRIIKSNSISFAYLHFLILTKKFERRFNFNSRHLIIVRYVIVIYIYNLISLVNNISMFNCEHSNLNVRQQVVAAKLQTHENTKLPHRN